MKLFSVALLVLMLDCVSARAAEKVEAALYWGRNTSPGILTCTAPKDLNERLREVFGFRHYELIKKDKIELGRHWTQWFIPRRDFFICLKPQRPEPDQPRLIDYEIYQEGFIVAKGKYEPNVDTPLFINGPDFKNGRLIFVLETR
jgi:hypothetical protein